MLPEAYLTGEDLGNDAKIVFIYFQVVTETEGTLSVKPLPLSVIEWVSESPNLFVLHLGITMKLRAKIFLWCMAPSLCVAII